jgi:hypothetical protein
VSAIPIWATLEEFDTRILELERQLVAVKTEGNNLLPVHRLPPEIVAKVFKLIQHGCQTVDEIRPWQTYDYMWLDVMLVCRRFREVAVQTSALWNMVDHETRSPDWIQLCLERACNQSLCIRDSIGESTKLLHRAWSLELDGIEAVSTQVLNSLQPTLHALHINGFNEQDQEQVFRFAQSDLHADLALAYLSLSHLCLQGILVRHSLHRIQLDNVVISTGWDGLMQILRQVPSVQILCLRHLALNSDDVVRSRMVSLPCLHSLLVVDTSEAVRRYLHMLPQPTLALGISVSGGESAEIRNIHPDILGTWLEFARSAHDPGLLAHGTLKKISSYRVKYHLGSGEMVTRLRHFGSASPISFCDFNCSGVQIEHPAAPYIHTLHIIHSRTFIDTDYPYQIRGLSYARNLPNLRSLVLEGFCELDAYWDLVQAIRGCLVERGTRIQQLRFVECSHGMKVPAHKLQEEGLVTTVDWVHDGATFEGGFDSQSDDESTLS